MLGDHRRAVGADLGQREAGVGQVGDFGEERVVAAGGLYAAFDDVAGDHRSGELVVVGAGPAEVRGRRSDDHRRVGDPAGDDDVGPVVEAVDDAPRAQVGVRGQRGAEPKFRRAGLQVVAFDVGDPGGDAQALGQRAYRVGQAGGVEAAGVGDDAYAAVARLAQAVLELGEEGLGVAAVGMFHPVATQDEHGEFGQVIAGEVVDRLV